MLASTVFGLLALTGSITLLAIVASAIVIAWVSYAGRPDEGDDSLLGAGILLIIGWLVVLGTLL